jgi:CBS domain-containing protein
MTASPAVVLPAQTVAEALELLMRHRLLALPVVERDQRYRGMFRRSLLIGRLLPRIAQLEDKLDNVARIIEAMGASETLDHVRARFAAIAQDRVLEHVDKITPPLRPDTPLMDTVHLLARTRSILPVVDERTGKLVGVVSAWDLLAKLTSN